MGRVNTDLDICYDDVVERRGKTFRRAGHSAYLITSCGQCVINANIPNVTRIYDRNPKFRYLHCGRDGKKTFRLHVLVALAWVWNPRPDVFKVVDHIDGDSQNNDASNLRWITPSLNGLNREVTDKSFRKIIRKSKYGKMMFWYQSLVTYKGVKHWSTSSRTPEEAIRKTALLRKSVFIKYYEKILEENPIRPFRAPYMHYWRDSNPTARDPLPDSRDGGHSEVRSAGLSL